MKEEVLKGVALAGALGWLIYWTGRWYKEWYFAQFQIPYEVLDFDTYYYFQGSWATVAVSILSLVILFNLAAAMVVRNSWPWMVLSLLIALAAIVRLFIDVPFHPDQNFLHRIVGSKDLSIMTLGVTALGLIIIASWRLPEAARALERIQVFIRNAGLLSWVGIIIVLWLHLALCGYLMGVYHGQAAIWEGKMGTKWVKSGGEWWILAVRADANRTFLFDRIQHRIKIVADDGIDEWDGPVTREPK